MLAYLIAAHADPAMLRRLIDALATEDTHFFIHIDRKSPLEPFAAACRGAPNLHFVEDRIRVNWAGWSQVAATLAMMRAVQRSGLAFRYCAFISGACYPLRSNRVLHDFLANSDGEFISTVKVPNVESDKPLSRFTCWFLEGGSRNKGALAFVKKAANKILARLPIRNVAKGLAGLPPYAGGNWWCLTGGSVDYILDFVDRNPRFVTFFHHVAFPDESFFQTVLMSGKRAGAVRPSLTYADWSNPQERPSFITPDHVRRLSDQRYEVGNQGQRSPVFFARKFASDRCAAALDLIDRDRAREDGSEPTERGLHEPSAMGCETAPPQS